MRRKLPASAALIAYGLASLAPAEAAEERFSIICAMIMISDTRNIMTQCGVPVPPDGEARYHRMRAEFQEAVRSTLSPAEAEMILAGEERRSATAAARAPNRCERSLAFATDLFARINTPEFEQKFGDVLRGYGPKNNPPGSCL